MRFNDCNQSLCFYVQLEQVPFVGLLNQIHNSPAELPNVWMVMLFVRR